MEISKVKLKSSGVKGAEITYKQVEEISSRSYNNENVKKCHAPVPKELKSNFNKLKFHLLSVSGHWKETFDKYFDKKNFTIDKNYKPKPSDIDGAYTELTTLINNTEILSVRATEIEFLIEATIKVLNSNKKIKIKTPLIDIEDDYVYFDDAIMIIREGIFVETEKYLTGESAADSSQFVLDFFTTQEGLKEEEAEEKVNGMTEQEREAMMDDFLSKHGVLFSSEELGLNNGTEESTSFVNNETEKEVEVKPEPKAEKKEEGKTVRLTPKKGYKKKATIKTIAQAEATGDVVIPQDELSKAV